MKLKKLLAISMAVLMLCTMTALSAAAQTEEVTTDPADLEEILVVKFSENYVFGAFHHIRYYLTTSVTPEAGWTFCYDTMLPDDTQIGGMGTLNPASSTVDGTNDANAYRNLFVQDKWGDMVRIADLEGWTAHPGTNLVPVAHKTWYSREMPLDDYLHTIDSIYFCVENPHTYLDDTGVPSAVETGVAFFKNICIKDADGEIVYYEGEIALSLVTKDRTRETELSIEAALSGAGIDWDGADYEYDAKQDIHITTWYFQICDD